MIGGEEMNDEEGDKDEDEEGEKAGAGCGCAGGDVRTLLAVLGGRRVRKAGLEPKAIGSWDEARLRGETEWFWVRARLGRVEASGRW